MPYRIERGSGGCAFAVVVETTGRRVGCHPTRARAEAQLAALYANVPEARGGKAFADLAVALKYREDQLRNELGRFEYEGGGSGSTMGGGGEGFSPDAAYDRMAEGKVARVPQEGLQTAFVKFADSPSVNLQKMQVEGKGNENLYVRHLREIGRSQMPQLPEDKEGQDRWLSFLDSKGIGYTLDEVDPRELIATQNDLDSRTVAAIKDYLDAHDGKLADSGGILIVSKENAIGDGHHRWGALAGYAATHPDKEVRVQILCVDTDIDTLLKAGIEFDVKEGIKPQGFGAAMTGAGFQAAMAEKKTTSPDHSKIPLIITDGDIDKPDWKYADWEKEMERRRKELTPPPAKESKAFADLAEALKYSEDQPRGEDGRWSGGSGTVAGTLSHLLRRQGGYSYQPITHKQPKDGYMVALPGHEKVFTSRPSVAELRSYLTDNAEALKDGYAGGWLDNETGTVYLDVSVRVDTPEEADRLSREYKQEAYFDVVKGESVYTRARGKAYWEGDILHLGHDGRGAGGSPRQPVRPEGRGQEEQLTAARLLWRELARVLR